MTSTTDLVSGELELTGQIVQASNATFVGRIGELDVVYKPIAGEKPLWDFPDGFLANREAAAHLVSEVLGWDVVPRTWLRDGPLGEGMVQLWMTVDPVQNAVDLVLADHLPEQGWLHVFDGYDAQDRRVSLIHEDSVALRQMAVFDIITNNADRKGGHILEMPAGHRYGIDHGLTFHAEHKLRTVLWGWTGQELSPSELEGVERVRAALSDTLGEALAPLLTPVEIAALSARCDRLLQTACFPDPHGEMPPIPWPPF